MIDNNCKNCNSPLNGKFCSNCGQKTYTEKDKSLTSLLHEGFHFMTHFDGKFFNTLKTIYQSPGKLSLDYSNGIRQKYYKPLSFYLLIIVLYLLFPLVDGMNMEMKYYKGNSFFGNHMSHKIEARLIEENITEEQLSEKFRDKSKTTSKFLLLLLIPMSALILYLLYFNRRRYLFDNIILVTEINIFFLMSYFVIMPILFLPLVFLFKVKIDDNIYGPITMITFIFYCVLVFHKVFNERWCLSILKGGIFGFMFMFLMITIYKTIVFEITFALI